MNPYLQHDKLLIQRYCDDRAALNNWVFLKFPVASLMSYGKTVGKWCTKAPTHNSSKWLHHILPHNKLINGHLASSTISKGNICRVVNILILPIYQNSCCKLQWLSTPNSRQFLTNTLVSHKEHFQTHIYRTDKRSIHNKLETSY